LFVATAELRTAGRPSAQPARFIIGESQALPAGCGQVTSGFPDGTPAELVAATVEPRDALTGIWRFDGSRWQGWSGAEDAPNDLTTINSRERIRICLSAAARWITPL
jgi:hypothetical protein